MYNKKYNFTEKKNESILSLYYGFNRNIQALVL